MRREGNEAGGEIVPFPDQPELITSDGVFFSDSRVMGGEDHLGIVRVGFERAEYADDVAEGEGMQVCVEFAYGKRVAVIESAHVRAYEPKQYAGA